MDKIAETILKILRLDNIVQNLTGFVEDRIALLKVEIREDVAKAMARGMVMVALFLMGFLFLIFFSVGLAHFINGYFEENYAGYWIVAAAYAAISLFLLIFRQNIFNYFETHFSEMIKKKSK